MAREQMTRSKKKSKMKLGEKQMKEWKGLNKKVEMREERMKMKTKTTENERIKDAEKVTKTLKKLCRHFTGS